MTERKRQEDEIRASRSRIIEAGDEARRVLERNLHDGAQQRLVSLSVSLRLAESLLDTDPERPRQAIISASREELAAALEELRELARGIHPAVLTDRGLAAALEALAARTPFPVEHRRRRRSASRPPVEAAAYYVVSEALTNVAKYAQATNVAVTVGTADECVVDVDDRRRRHRWRRSDGRHGPARALGPRRRTRRHARRSISPAGEGTRIEAEIPLRGSEPLE